MSTPCQAEPDLWFSSNPDDILEAKTACNTCPVANECARLALAIRPSDGIWAGKTPEERGRANCGIHEYRRVTDDHVRRARLLRAAGNSWSEVGRILDVSTSAVAKAVARADERAAVVEIGRAAS